MAQSWFDRINHSSMDGTRSYSARGPVCRAAVPTLAMGGGGFQYLAHDAYEAGFSPDAPRGRKVPQRDKTLALMEGFQRALAGAEEEAPGKRSAALRRSYQGMIRQLEDELREYGQLRPGKLTLPHVERLDQIAPFIVKIRIAKGVSQTELGRRLGVSMQVISRYEESDYQAVAIARLQEILDAIGIKTLVTLSA